MVQATPVTVDAVHAAAAMLALRKHYQRPLAFWPAVQQTTIRTQRGVVPFTPFPWQQRWVDGLTRRELILKSRDIGSSEICVRVFAWRVLTDGGNLLIKADKHANAVNLVSMARHFLASLPAAIRPTLARDNETELEIAGKGTIRALARGGGRSERCRYLILTERAFWEDSADEVADVTGALVADGWQVIESTANGFNEFHTLWQDSNGYRKTFVGRWDNPGHTEQWWVDKQAELAAMPSLLAQEFPDSPEAAFIASGLCLFDKQAILAAQAVCYPPATVTEVREQGFGLLRVWQQPVPGRRYVAGADVAEGHDAGNQRLDYSGVAVYDHATCEHVADLHGQWPPDVFARQAAELCRRYNGALLGVERNNHGHAVIAMLRAGNYPALYQHVEPDPTKPSRSQAQYGWPTNAATKPLLEQELGAAIAAGTLRSPDSAFWDECLSYVNLGSGRTGAQPGTHDDRVIKHAIALMMRKSWQPLRDPGAVPISLPLVQPDTQADRLHLSADEARQKALAERMGLPYTGPRR